MTTPYRINPLSFEFLTRNSFANASPHLDPQGVFNNSTFLPNCNFCYSVFLVVEVSGDVEQLKPRHMAQSCPQLVRCETFEFGGYGQD